MAQTGGYGVQSNAPSVSIQYGSKGTDVSAAKTGEAIKSPEPVLPKQANQQTLPPLQGTQNQWSPNYGYQQPYSPSAQPVVPQNEGQGYVYPNPQQVYGQQQYAPAQNLQAYQQNPQYQNPYGQQYAPQQYQQYPGQYQYPPAK
jgi:hypothetical protein